jgi:hypothetical protein
MQILGTRLYAANYLIEGRTKDYRTLQRLPLLLERESKTEHVRLLSFSTPGLTYSSRVTSPQAAESGHRLYFSVVELRQFSNLVPLDHLLPSHRPSSLKLL